MRRAFVILILSLVLLLTGCAMFEELLIDTQEIAMTGEANPEIRATFSYIDDFVDKPWDKLSAVGIGYALALFRRWYKKKKGAKTT